MPYTLLRVSTNGLVLGAYHERRMAVDPHAAEAWSRFASSVAPGIWSVWLDAGRLEASQRPASRLHEGMPSRLRPSPIVGQPGTRPKPRSPSPYDTVRAAGIVTLLTSADGREIYEACSAAVLGWNNRRLVCVPDDRPRVWSTAETAVRDHLQTVDAPILTDAAMPLLLVNAVKGCCAADLPGRPAFPADVRREIERLFEALTVRSQPPTPPR